MKRKNQGKKLIIVSNESIFSNTPIFETDNQPITTIVEKLLKSGRTKDAEQLMKESNFSSEVVLSMIRAACMTRRAELAYQYSQRLENGIVSEIN